MCGRRKIERNYPEIAMKYADMDFDLVEKIASELPPNIIVQLHNNGESLLYRRFADAVKLFNKQIVNVVSNGILLVEKADEIIGNLDTIAISVFENDDKADEQYEILLDFLKLKADRKPNVILRLNGNVNGERYKGLGIIARRVLHSPMGSFGYKKKEPTIPEIGICLDFLHHLAINQKGDVSICVRFDPRGLGVLGNLNNEALGDIWTGKKRMQWMEFHKLGKRGKVPLCEKCEFWGVPTGYKYE